MKKIPVHEAIALEKALCRQNLSDFIHKSFTIVSPGVEYADNWHIDAIAEHLHAVHTGEIRRLIINMPPRSLKSISTSIAFPAWLLGKNPSSQIIVASYAKSLSIKHSVDTRLIVENPFYKSLFPQTIISDDQNEKGKFQTTKRGHRIATSVGSGITGEGGDYLIVDDPVNPTEALSEVARNGANSWFDQTLISRQNDQKTSRIIVVMQRLHFNDLTGHLLEKGGWEHLCLPIKSDQTRIISMGGYEWKWAKDELLHPERIGEEEIANLQKELGPYGFAGQYMQSPVPLGGGEFKIHWIQYYEPNSQHFNATEMNLWICVDPANEKKTSSDYTAMIVWGLAPDNNYYVLDIVRDRLNPTERVDILMKLHMKWTKKTGKPPQVAYEKYGMMTDTHYIKKAQDKLNHRFHIVEVGGKLKKEDRIRRLIPLFEQSRIYLPGYLIYQNVNGERVELIEDFIKNELETFPVGVHDDLLDAMARICDDDLYATFPMLRQKVVIDIAYGDKNEINVDDWRDC